MIQGNGMRDPGSGIQVSIVIPTLNAGRYLPKLLHAFQKQDFAGEWELVVVDSSSDDDTREQLAAYASARVVQITKESFTHGYARNLGVRESKGEFVVFVSQDALPNDSTWLSSLVSPYERASVGATFSRQVPYPGANPIERTFIDYWFPDRRIVTPGRREDPAEEIRFLDVFFSNVSSSARREVVLRHPFLENIIMSEDQQFARDIVRHGHDIVYTPESVVLHSHDYSLREIFQRYFDSAYSLTDIFDHRMGESLKAGRRYLPHECKTVVRMYPLWIPYYLVYFLTKGLAVFAGHFAKHMPRKLARACSMHKRYWDNPERNVGGKPNA
jgi:rhamnosyltransferase